MKLNELKKIIRTTIKTEVRKAIREELTEIMIGKAMKEQSTSLSSVVKKQKPKVKPTNQKKFTSNPQLNEILNQTVGFNNNGMADLEDDKTVSLDSSVAQSGDLRGRFAQLMGLDDGGSNIGGSSIENNVTQTAAAMGRSVEQVPDDVTKAMTRDYSGLMKAIDKKKNGGPLK